MNAPIPRTAIFVRPDTLGDLVLFAPTLRCLRAAWPGTRLAVVIRQGYLDLAPLLAPDVEWIATSIDPFARGPVESAVELARLREVFAALAPDLVAGACPRRNWLETALAAACPAARRVALGPLDDDPFHAVQLRYVLRTTAAEAFTESVDHSAHAQDWQRDYCLAEHLLGHAVERTPPGLVLGAGVLARADDVLSSLGLVPGRYVACAAAGFANVRLKTWPAERFAAAIAWLHAKHGLRTLLVGHEGERAHLEGVRDGAGTAAPTLWLGRDGELPLLAGLLARSTLYFGNDTGAMHLAAALDRPVVAVFGGGTWPRFLPAARQGLALVHPLPCFGCGWDCPFGDAPCLRAVGLDDAQSALADVLARMSPQKENHAGGAVLGRDTGAGRGTGPLPRPEASRRDGPYREVRTLHTLPDAMVELMDRTAALAREREAAHAVRHRRNEALVEREILPKEREIDALKQVCDDREALILRQDSHIKHFQSLIADKDRHIANLDAEIARLRAAAPQKKA